MAKGIDAGQLSTAGRGGILAIFPNDAAFENEKDTLPEEGDRYWNSEIKAVREYDGVRWTTQGGSAGDVKCSMRSTPDPGWLRMNLETIGNALSGADHQGEIYRELFDILKNVQPNAGTEDFDSNHTVQIPEAEARVFVGWKSGDPNFGTLGATGGAANHTHTIPAQGTIRTGGVVDRSGDNWVEGTIPGGDFNHKHDLPSHNHGGTTGASGSVAFPFLVGNWFIKY
jgi:hypothetical protein